jgi:glycosyltransferase involved in cell wall biosynthesis
MMAERPMVVIDARMVGPTMHGMARYVSQLAEGLGTLPEEPPYEPVFIVSKDWAEKGFHGFGSVSARSAFLSPLELVELPALLRGAGAALYHSPSFSSLLWSPVPWIATVHDLNHLQFGGAKERLYYRTLLSRFARGARALVTVSEFSRRELSDWTGVPETEIEVAYNALDTNLAIRPSEADLGKRLGARGLERGRYFFCLSNPKPHKNVALLLAAYRAYRAEGGTWPLVLSLDNLAAEPGVVAIGATDEDETRALLAGAGALAFPSRYEGFGLPPVEAAAMGVPLVVSDIPPHREGLVELRPDEALWVAPADRAGWTRALAHAASGGLASPSLDSRTRTLQRFSTRNLGRHMDRIYRRVLERN